MILLNYRFTLLADLCAWRNALKWSRFINQCIFLANGNNGILFVFYDLGCGSILRVFIKLVVVEMTFLFVSN